MTHCLGGTYGNERKPLKSRQKLDFDHSRKWYSKFFEETKRIKMCVARVRAWRAWDSEAVNVVSDIFVPGIHRHRRTYPTTPTQATLSQGAITKGLGALPYI